MWMCPPLALKCDPDVTPVCATVDVSTVESSENSSLLCRQMHTRGYIHVLRTGASQAFGALSDGGPRHHCCGNSSHAVREGGVDLEALAHLRGASTD